MTSFAWTKPARSCHVHGFTTRRSIRQPIVLGSRTIRTPFRSSAAPIAAKSGGSRFSGRSPGRAPQPARRSSSTPLLRVLVSATQVVDQRPDRPRERLADLFTGKAALLAQARVREHVVEVGEHRLGATQLRLRQLADLFPQRL